MSDRPAEEREPRNVAPLPVVSASRLLTEAEHFRSHFEGCYCAWEVCGEVRRGRPASSIVHVVRPEWDEDFGHEDLLRRRGRELVGERVTSPALATLPPVGGVEGWVCLYRGRPHWVWTAWEENWGVALALHTGPEAYWAELVRRLTAAQVLTIVDDRVCWLDAASPRPGFRPVECPTEEEFFRLARTEWVPPERRRGPRGRWALGILPPYYPPSVPAPPATGGEPPLARALLRRPRRAKRPAQSTATAPSETPPPACPAARPAPGEVSAGTPDPMPDPMPDVT